MNAYKIITEDFTYSVSLINENSISLDEVNLN